MRNKHGELEMPPGNSMEAAALFGFSRLVYAGLVQRMYPGILNLLDEKVPHLDPEDDFGVDLISGILSVMDDKILTRMEEEYAGLAWDDEPAEPRGLAY